MIYKFHGLAKTEDEKKIKVLFADDKKKKFYIFSDLEDIENKTVGELLKHNIKYSEK